MLWEQAEGQARAVFWVSREQGTDGRTGIQEQREDGCLTVCVSGQGALHCTLPAIMHHSTYFLRSRVEASTGSTVTSVSLLHKYSFIVSFSAARSSHLLSWGPFETEEDG